jgi:hypothetical protein
MDYRFSGPVRTLISSAARMGKAFFMDVPLLVLSILQRDSGRALGVKCLLWRAQGYIRMTLRLLSPSIFDQRKFIEQMEFRKEKRSLTGELTR